MAGPTASLSFPRQYQWLPLTLPREEPANALQRHWTLGLALLGGVLSPGRLPPHPPSLGCSVIPTYDEHHVGVAPTGKKVQVSLFCCLVTAFVEKEKKKFPLLSGDLSSGFREHVSHSVC